MAKKAKSSKAPKGTRGSRKRRGTSEAMTGKKENEVEVRTIGDNSGLNLPEPIALDDGDFDLHYKALRSAKDKMDTAKRLYDGCCKGAKKVSPELLEAVKRAIKYDGQDANDIKADLEIAGYVLRRRGSPVQITVFDTLIGDVKEQAASRGLGDGENGRPSASSYPAGSDLDQIYSDNWRLGQAKLLGLPPDQAESALEGETAH
jgi:hypothetical protein